MYERFTDKARNALVLAHDEARSRKCEHIGTEHLLIALCLDDEGPVMQILRCFEADISLVQLRAAMEEHSPCGVSDLGPWILGKTPRVERVVKDAIAESARLRHNHQSPLHLFSGLLLDPQSEYVACKMLRDLGIIPRNVRAVVLQRLDGLVAAPLCDDARTQPVLPRDEAGARAAALVLEVGDDLGFGDDEWRALLNFLKTRSAAALLRPALDLFAEE